MKNHIIKLFTICACLVGFSTPLYAVVATPSTATGAPGSQVTIQLTASAPSGSNANAVAIRLNVANATVTSFTPATGGSWVGSTGDCTGGTSFTSTTVCASLASSSPIPAGTPLGTLVVQLGSAGTATITRGTGNAYSDGTDTFADEGALASFSVSGTGGGNNNAGGNNLPSTLPETSFGNDLPKILAILSSLSLITLGVYLYKLSFIQNTNEK
jgi:hypothetical protein